MKYAPNFYALWTNKNTQAPRNGAFSVDLVEAEKLNKEGFDIFWTMNGFDLGKRKKEDLKTINCFYADLDCGTDDEMKRVVSMSPEPNTIIKTGKGYHLYWYLDKPIECESDPIKFCDYFREFTTSRIVSRLNADPQAADACRLLRASFFKYWKDGLGEKHADIVFEMNNFYSLDKIKKYFPEKKIIKKQFKIVDQKQENFEGKDFWTRANRLDCVSSLEKLSGTSHVFGETYSVVTKNKITRINCNGKKANVWIDANGYIGSASGAGPAIPNWLYWYHKDWKKVAEILKEVWPELETK